MYAEGERNGLKLQRDERLFNMENAIFEACERGKMSHAKKLLKRNVVDLTQLAQLKTKGDGGTCLHLAVLSGNRDFLKKLLLPQFINEGNKQGDTALHLAVRKYRVDLVKPLLKAKPDLRLENKRGETPVCIAVKFGFLDIIKKFIDHEPKAMAVQILCEDKKLLHCAVERNPVQIVNFFVNEKTGILKDSINQPFEVPPTNSSTTKSSDNGIVRVNDTKPSDNEGKRDKETANSQPIVDGDTPLHIAARNKNEPKVRGVSKHALNGEGETPLDVARKVTDYHECFRIIKKLTDYGRDPKPFMYCTPEVSQEKREKAMHMVNKGFEDKRNTELVVAALLATMTFTAVFTVPGGFYQDKKEGIVGSPVLIDFTMFKLFIIFDCISFFLSLFVCIMWQMASELTTEDKMMFMTVNSLLTCLSFGFNSCGFMAAVYTILAHKVRTLAWVILGILLLITLCGTIAFIHQATLFVVARARFHRLCGVPRLLDDIVEAVWKKAEDSGLLNIIRKLDDASHDALEGDVDEPSNKAGEDEHQHEHGYNCSWSSSPCLRHVPQSV